LYPLEAGTAKLEKETKITSLIVDCTAMLVSFWPPVFDINDMLNQWLIEIK
jgi:hypothetical protein